MLYRRLDRVIIVISPLGYWLPTVLPPVIADASCQRVDSGDVMGITKMNVAQNLHICWHVLFHPFPARN